MFNGLPLGCRLIYRGEGYYKYNGLPPQEISKIAQQWAYKYSEESGGIKTHADEAAVNVNMWLTPDESNVGDDAHGGGLVVHLRRAPLDWDFDSINGPAGAPKVKGLLKGAPSVRIPYRANRAVIFDSNFFHRTDDFKFRPWSESILHSRINLTLLYGKRADDAEKIAASRRDPEDPQSLALPFRGEGEQGRAASGGDTAKESEPPPLDEAAQLEMEVAALLRAHT